MENESLICQHVGNFFPFGAFFPSLTFLTGIDRRQIYLSSIHCLCSSGICVLHHSACLWDGVQSTGSGNTFIFFQPKSATERLLKRLIITQIKRFMFSIAFVQLKRHNLFFFRAQSSLTSWNSFLPEKASSCEEDKVLFLIVFLWQSHSYAHSWRTGS